MNKTDYWKARCELSEWLYKHCKMGIYGELRDEYCKKFEEWRKLVNTPEPESDVWNNEECIIHSLDKTGLCFKCGKQIDIENPGEEQYVKNKP